jgi:hypothetical protein
MRARAICARRYCFFKPCQKHFLKKRPSLPLLHPQVRSFGFLMLIRAFCLRDIPLVAGLNCGISVGTANCFLSAAYSLSPIVAGGVIQKARACMYVLSHRLSSCTDHLLFAQSLLSSAKRPRAATSVCARLQVAEAALLLTFLHSPVIHFIVLIVTPCVFSAKILRAESGEINLPFTASAKVFVLRS